MSQSVANAQWACDSEEIDYLPGGTHSAAAADDDDKRRQHLPESAATFARGRAGNECAEKGEK